MMQMWRASYPSRISRRWQRWQAVRCGIFLLSLLLPGFAEKPLQKLEPFQFQYTRTLWRVSEGLPEDTVQAIAESRDGRLWIGTTGGLVRFDGSHMEVNGLGLIQPISANSIFCLTIGRDDSLWVGTEGGGLLRIQAAGNLKVYTSRQGLTDGFVRSVYEDDRSRVWIGTDDGLFVLEGDHVQRVDQGKNIAPIAVHSITEDNEHRIWVGGSRLLAIRPDGSEQEFSLPGKYSENRVKRIFQTKDGTIWVGTVGGLQRFRAGHFESVPGIHATVRSLAQTSDGTLWIGTIGNGLWTLQDARLTQVNQSGILPSDTVLSIFEDDRRQIWIGTQAGLVRLAKTPISIIALPENGDPDYETISGDNRGDVWVAAQNLYLIRNGIARRVQYEGLEGVTIRNVYRARDGALWIGTDGSGAYRMEGGKTTHYTAPTVLTNNFIRGFLESRDGSMWIATDEGVSHIGSSGPTRWTEANGLAYFSTRSLLEDRQGILWIGTDHGLSEWKDGHFLHGETTRRLAQEKIWSILQDRNGALWFGTRDHGLFRYSDGKLRQLTTTQGLPSDSVYQILQDRSGMFWLTGPNTIASIPEADMQSSYSSANKPLSVKVYNMPFGAEGAQLYGGRQPSGYLAPDDSVWFSTSRGAAHFTKVDHEDSAVPGAHLDAVAEDGREISPNPNLRVPANVARLSFAFSAISLQSQEGIRFRYRLEGFDSTWNSAGTNHVATYTNLPAGHYQFKLQAFDTANPEMISEVALLLVKEPFFYQTWWFYLFSGALLAGVAWGIYQIRLRQIGKRFTAVLEERSRLARELHDTVIQGCTGVSALLEAIASTPETNTEIKNDLLEYARDQARATINEARQAVWDMRRERENEVELIEAIRRVAMQTTKEFATEVEFEHDMETLEVAASSAHEILMTVREAVYNSVQHSDTKNVRIEVCATREDLIISVADLGGGFIVSNNLPQDGHYGIVGMRERMQRLGGRFELTSFPGGGTTVKLWVRRKPTQPRPMER
jgi:ligand-binding sensor domain-containing protein/two-component sensor histidine kinase